MSGASGGGRRGATLVLVGALVFGTGCRRHADSTPAFPRSSLEVEALPGRRLSYLHSGDPAGVRVIYVHGTPGDALAWKSYLRTPVPGTESVAVDRLGFGASRSSSGSGAVPSFHRQAAAIAPLLTVRGGRGSILVGHSLGGPIVCRIAAEHPEAVGGVVVLAGSMAPEMESWHWYNRLAGTRIGRWIVPGDLFVANEEVREAAEQERELSPLLGTIHGRVIVIHGSKDRLVPVANAPWLRDRLTGAASVEVRILEGEGHFLPWEREADVRAAVAALAGPRTGPDSPSPGAPAR